MHGGHLAGLFALVGVPGHDFAEGAVLIAGDGVERAARQDLVGLEALAAGISLFCRLSIMHNFFLLFDSLCLLVAGRSSVTP